MKKQTQTNKKLRLETSKIRVLTSTELDIAVGGITLPTRQCNEDPTTTDGR